MWKSQGLLQQLLCSKSHDFLAIFALAHSNINQLAKILDDDVRNHGLRTPNEGKNQRNLKIQADVADKICCRHT
jgi:hypothetical protein